MTRCEVCSRPLGRAPICPDCERWAVDVYPVRLMVARLIAHLTAARPARREVA